jgi:hypothetical protein
MIYNFDGEHPHEGLGKKTEKEIRGIMFQRGDLGRCAVRKGDGRN